MRLVQKRAEGPPHPGGTSARWLVILCWALCAPSERGFQPLNRPSPAPRKRQGTETRSHPGSRAASAASCFSARRQALAYSNSGQLAHVAARRSLAASGELHSGTPERSPLVSRRLVKPLPSTATFTTLLSAGAWLPAFGTSDEAMRNMCAEAPRVVPWSSRSSSLKRDLGRCSRHG